MKIAVVTLKQLGLNCWLPARFVGIARCLMVFFCTHPEKKACKAVPAEIAYLEGEKRKAVESFDGRIRELKAGKESE